MAVDLRFSLPAAGVTAVSAAVLVIRAAIAPAPVPARKATAAERREIAHEIATQEHEWEKQVRENFPRDDWSQSDDFHGREFKELVKQSRERGVRIEDALRAVDDDLHQLKASGPNAPDPRSAHAVPCKPRPFYD
jgi:hypothetical protein